MMVFILIARRPRGGSRDGVDSRTSRAPTNKALTEEQEQAIMRYIDQLDKGEHIC